MWYNFKIEWRRYWQEMFHFKFNLLFANIGLITLFSGLLEYLQFNNPEIIFVLLFVWYSATHGFMNINFIIEEEIMDGTIIHILETKISFLKVIFLRSIIQIIYDLFKSILVFSILLLIGNIDYTKFNGLEIMIIISLILLSIIISYGIGLVVGVITLKFKKISAIPSLLYHFVLFFGGIIYDVSMSPSLNILSYLFPFMPLRHIMQDMLIGNFNILYLCVLIIQAIIYFSIGIFLYKVIIKENLRTGRMFYV